jgi:D-alanyl-D-alanine carboxypeptidase/D-alanyl-D-alanine-endopeptidase (penicillin-binding protein 4)
VPRRPVLAAVCALFALLPGTAQALGPAGLKAKLTREARLLGGSSGLYVRDLDTGTTLFALREDLALVPASNTKLWVTAAALLELGGDATLPTRLLGLEPSADGVIDGNVTLVGGGDPYLTGTQVTALAQQLVDRGVTRIKGRVLADASLLDRRVGSVDSGFAFDRDLGGRLAALAVNGGRGADPALHAAQLVHDALRHAHVELDGRPRRGVAGETAVELAAHDSAPLAAIVGAINRPSDNYAAELLLKDLGALKGGAGTTTAGAAVVRASLAALGIHPRIVDGSGLSRAGRATPRQLVRLLERMRAQPVAEAFDASLPRAGRQGTLAKRMRGTAASGQCRAKTGTLIGVSALSGYCTTTGGATVAFSFLENGVCNVCAKKVEDRMTAAIARYAAPSSASRPGSSSTATPRRSAFSSLDPGESPATR